MARPAENGPGATSTAGLDLPETTAKEDLLVTQGGKLEALAGTITGRGASLGSYIGKGAREFSEVVHPQIAARGKASIAATEKGTGAALYGAMVAEALAEDVTDFKGKLRRIVQRWEAAQANDFGVDGSGPQFKGMTGNERLGAMKGVIADEKAKLKAELEADGRKAKSELETKGKQRKSQLEAGPTPQTLKQLGDTISMGWAAFNLWQVPNAARRRAAELLRSAKTTDLTAKERAELNRMLRAVAKDKESAVWLLNKTGPKGYLEGYANALYDGKGDAKFQKQFQLNMAAVLALGTAAGPKLSPIQKRGLGVSQQWKEQFYKLMGDKIKISPDRYGNASLTVTGDQVVAPMLEHGKYGKDFLVGVSDAIWERREDDGQRGLLAPGQDPKDLQNWLNPARPGGFNPLESSMIALGNNPDAAAGFFSGSKERLSRIDWLLEHADNDSVPDFDGSVPIAGPDRTFNIYDDFAIDKVGRALEAASTGREWDSPRDAERVAHTTGNNEVTRRLMEYVGGNAKDFTSDGAGYQRFRDNLTDVAVDHIEDIHYAMNNQDGGKYHSPGEPLKLPGFVDGSNHDKQRFLHEFIKLSGRDPDNQGYLAGASNEVSNRLLSDVLKDSDGLKPKLAEGTLEPHARIMNLMAQGESEKIREGYEASDEDHNKKLMYFKEGTKFVAATGIGFGTGVTMGPAAGAVTSAGAGQAAGYGVEWLSTELGLEQDSGDKIREEQLKSIEHSKVKQHFNQMILDTQKVKGVPDLDDGERERIVNDLTASYLNGLYDK